MMLRCRRRLVLEGTGWVRVGDERYTVGPQHTVIIPAETPHAWGNSGPDVAKLSWAFARPHPFRDSTSLGGAPPTYAPPERAKTGDSVRRSLSGAILCPIFPITRLPAPSAGQWQQLHNSHGAPISILFLSK
jgi:gentisate 1,2-dioxygenase